LKIWAEGPVTDLRMMMFEKVLKIWVEDPVIDLRMMKMMILSELENELRARDCFDGKWAKSPVTILKSYRF
jgi:hypothetical protein